MSSKGSSSQRRDARPAGEPKGERSKGEKRKGATARKGRAGRGERETSAGGVVVRDASSGGDTQVVVIVPTRRAPDGAPVLGLPKGHIDPGENALQAATREVREETGLVAELVRELGEVRYWYRREGRTIAKSVAFYLFSYVSGDVADHDDEVEEARWIDLKDAQVELSHAGERQMVTRALACLQEDR
jgi:8-oxo-dGTP pyrophosphatase MutT (NUDIX family)